MPNAQNEFDTDLPLSSKEATANQAGTAQLKLDAHPDVFLLAVCAELVAIEADTENRIPYEDRRAKLMKKVLGLDAVTLDGCRARLRAMEAAWPDILKQLHGSPMRPEDEVYWRDYKRLPIEETAAQMRARLKKGWEAKANPPLTPAVVLERALEAASQRTVGLHDGLLVLDAMTGADDGIVTIRADALEWIVKRLKKDADDIQNDLDYAKKAREGELYDDAHVAYAENKVTA